LSETENMCSRPEFHALFESSTAADQDPAVFTLSGVDRGGREFTLPRGPAFDVGTRGIYRPIIPPPLHALHCVLSLDGLRTAFGTETRSVDGFKHVLNASDMLLMLFDFAPQYQKLPLGVLLHALLTAFSLSLRHPDSAPHKQKTTAPSVHNGKGRRPIYPDARLRLRMARVRSSPRHHRMGVDSQSAALGTALTTPHDDFWPRTTSQPHRLSFQIEKNKTESPRCRSAPTSPRSAGEVAVIRHRAPLTPVLQTKPFQTKARQTDPNQTERPPSLDIRRSPRPVRRPSADPVLPQPMSFTSSDVAVFLSARRDEASANDTPGSQIEELMTPK
ncbi:hypothetical protein THAOC_01820, partial [Thalassiosira oceanica]